MGTISKDFSYKEFEASAVADRKHICNTIVSFDVRDSIKALVDEVLQALRDAWGMPLHINSGFRCRELNEAVGGVPTSQHCKGCACDIASDNPIELARLAVSLNLPYDQLIVYPTFVHFSHKLEGRQRKQVLYNKSYRGEKI